MPTKQNMRTGDSCMVKLYASLGKSLHPGTRNPAFPRGLKGCLTYIADTKSMHNHCQI